eukprot:334033-Rhodomonas_salina.1
MFDTDVRYDATVCYAMSGTESGYDATVCYAMSGTESGYAATRNKALFMSLGLDAAAKTCSKP